MVIETHPALVIVLLASFNLLVQRSHGNLADIPSTFARNGEPMFIIAGGMYYHRSQHAACIVNEICKRDACLSIHVPCCLQRDVEYSMDPAFT